MAGKRWNSKEIDLIINGVPDEDVAQITGRTIKAVMMMRNRLNGVYDIMNEIPLANILSQDEKETRLYNLMNKLGVRLKEKA